jgi:hypothetical protein
MCAVMAHPHSAHLRMPPESSHDLRPALEGLRLFFTLSPALGAVSTYRPLKPGCALRTGARPWATRTTSALISGGNRMFATLAYTFSPSARDSSF